jgi:uncharacterized protein involved in exopolysaccharide biosynthesis
VSTQASLRGVEDRKYALESTIQGALSTLQSDKDVLLRKYTAQYAEVIKKDQQMARLQALLNQLRLKAVSPEASGGDDLVTSQFRAQVTSVISELGSLSREEQRLQGELAGAQSGESVASVHELDVKEIERDVDLYRKAYADSLLQQQRAQKQVGIEQRQESQTYRLIDPPTLPVLPIAPNVVKFNLGGAAAGLFIGIALALLAELRQNALHSEAELVALAQVPLVLNIPLMQSPREERRKKFWLVAEWLGASAVLLIIAATELYVLRRG